MKKFTYQKILQGKYAEGWEDLCAGSSKEMRDNLKDYKQNEGGQYRIITRRILN